MEWSSRKWKFNASKIYKQQIRILSMECFIYEYINVHIIRYIANVIVAHVVNIVVFSLWSLNTLSFCWADKLSAFHFDGMWLIENFEIEMKFHCVWIRHSLLSIYLFIFLLLVNIWNISNDTDITIIIIIVAGPKCCTICKSIVYYLTFDRTTEFHVMSNENGKRNTKCEWLKGMVICFCYTIFKMVRNSFIMFIVFSRCWDESETHGGTFIELTKWNIQMLCTWLYNMDGFFFVCVCVVRKRYAENCCANFPKEHM